MRTLLLALCFVVTGAMAQDKTVCEKDAGWKYDYFLPIIRSEVTIKFFKSKDMKRDCGNPRAKGCAWKTGPTTYSIVLMDWPKDFNDRVALCHLGHEVLHTLGARHELVRNEPPVRDLADD